MESRKALMKMSNLRKIYSKKTPESLKKYKKQKIYYSMLYKKRTLEVF